MLFVLVAIFGRRVVTLNAVQGAEAAFAERRPGEALGWLDVARRWGTETPRVQILTARAHRKLGDLNEFRQTLETAIDNGVDVGQADRELALAKASAGRVDDVAEQLPDLILNSDGDGREICESFVNGYIANYRIEDAQPLLDIWQRDYPDDPQVYLMRGRVEEHKGNWQGAKELYRESLMRSPGYGPAAYNLARVYLNEKDTEQALKQYRVAAEWLNNPAPALIGVAHCNRLLRRPDVARETLTPLLDVDADDMAHAFRQVGQTADAADVAVDAEMGQIELAAGNFEAAVEYLEGAVERSPQNHSLRYSYGRALAGCGRTDEAAEHIEFFRVAEKKLARLSVLMEQLRGDSSDADVRSEIGQVFLEYISENQALVWLHSALTFDADHVATHRTLAAYYAARVDESAAGRKNAERAAYHQGVLTKLGKPLVDDPNTATPSPSI